MAKKKETSLSVLHLKWIQHCVPWRRYWRVTASLCTATRLCTLSKRHCLGNHRIIANPASSVKSSWRDNQNCVGKRVHLWWSPESRIQGRPTKIRNWMGVSSLLAIATMDLPNTVWFANQNQRSTTSKSSRSSRPALGLRWRHKAHIYSKFN